MTKLQMFKEGLLIHACVEYGNNRMKYPERYYQIIDEATDMTDIVICVSWDTYKWDPDTYDMATVKDKEYECLVYYNEKNDKFEILKNLWDSPVPDFPMPADEFIELLRKSSCKYHIIGAWKKETDFQGKFPW